MLNTAVGYILISWRYVTFKARPFYVKELCEEQTPSFLPYVFDCGTVQCTRLVLPTYCIWSGARVSACSSETCYGVQGNIGYGIRGSCQWEIYLWSLKDEKSQLHIIKYETFYLLTARMCPHLTPQSSAQNN